MRSDRWLAPAIGALIVLAAVWPWPLRPFHVLGSPQVEADNHLWMLWAGRESLFGRGEAWIGWPVGDPRPVQDLVNLPVAFLGMSVDPAFGYGLVLTVNVAVAAVGGYLLSRAAGAGPRAATVGMAALATCGALGGALVFGLSEAMPLGLYALHLAAWRQTARVPDWRWSLAGGAALAAYGLSGWYAVVFAALGAPAAVLWVVLEERLDRPRLLCLGAQWALAALVLLPFLVAFLSSEGAADLASRELPAWRFHEDWRHGSWGGTDVLNLFLPSLQHTDLSRSAYLGVAVLVLAAIAAVKVRAARPLVAGAFLFAVLALGRDLTVAGHPWVGETPLALPAAWLQALAPPLAGVRWWYRAAGPALVWLAPAAALGAKAWGGDRRWPIAVMAVVVAVDGLFLSDAPWPRPTYDARPPADLVQIAGSGPLIVLPFDRGDKRISMAPRPWQRWQPWLRRPVSESYETADPLGQDPVLDWLDTEARGGMWRPDAFRVGDEAPAVPSPEERAASRGRWEELGTDRLVLLRAASTTPKRAEGEISAILGPPEGGNTTAVWWRLGAR